MPLSDVNVARLAAGDGLVVQVPAAGARVRVAAHAHLQHDVVTDGGVHVEQALRDARKFVSGVREPRALHVVELIVARNDLPANRTEKKLDAVTFKK